MPLPFILGAGAAALSAIGVGAGIHGAVKAKDAKDTMESAQYWHEKNMARFEKTNSETSRKMDELGRLELEMLQSFDRFSNIFEKIKNKPIFETYSKNGVTLPRYDGEKLKEVSVGAGVLLGAAGGAGLGVIGGYAAAGATTAAVMALGTASTGTAIATLHGAALANATLAALGGGSIAAGGGGVLLGAKVLSVASLGVGLLVGGVVFNITGSKLSNQADEAWSQMRKAEREIDKICAYLVDLRGVAERYYNTLSDVASVYRLHLNRLDHMVNVLGHDDWRYFTNEEKQLTENTVLLVGLIYNMCKVELVLKSEKEGGFNTINQAKITETLNGANAIMGERF